MSKVIETLTKVTGLPSGLFNETASKTRGALTQKIFDCPAESDEYEVLINSKEEVIQIKNAYNTWDKEIIENLLNPPVQPEKEREDNSQNQSLASSAVPTTPPPAVQNYPPAFQNMSILNVQPLIQYVVDFVKLNPGCISSKVGTSVNEASTYNTSVWELLYMELHDIDDTYEFTFHPVRCGDQAIQDLYTITLFYNFKTGNIDTVSEY